MNRYVIKFSKEGVIRYISHLDLLRLFKRSFKRAGIKLVHSQGFNPHPKMGFAQPLSLGYSSTAEYLEFEAAEPYPAELIREKIDAMMPEGISILSCKELPETGKTLAALTEAASYEISVPYGGTFTGMISEIAGSYLDREQILVAKHQKKTGKDIEVDIKPMILGFNATVDNNYIMITARLSAGSTANLSPEMVLSSFCQFSGIEYDRAEVLMRRTELCFSGGEPW